MARVPAALYSAWLTSNISLWLYVCDRGAELEDAELADTL